MKKPGERMSEARSSVSSIDMLYGEEDVQSVTITFALPLSFFFLFNFVVTFVG